MLGQACEFACHGIELPGGGCRWRERSDHRPAWGFKVLSGSEHRYGESVCQVSAGSFSAGGEPSRTRWGEAFVAIAVDDAPADSVREVDFIASDVLFPGFEGCGRDAIESLAGGAVSSPGLAERGRLQEAFVEGQFQEVGDLPHGRLEIGDQIFVPDDQVTVEDEGVFEQMVVGVVHGRGGFIHEGIAPPSDGPANGDDGGVGVADDVNESGVGEQVAEHVGVLGIFYRFFRSFS